MLAQSEVFEDEILSRPENTDNPTEEMPEQRNHSRYIIRTQPIEPLAKLLILRLHNRLTMDNIDVLNAGGVLPELPPQSESSPSEPPKKKCEHGIWAPKYNCPLCKNPSQRSRAVSIDSEVDGDAEVHEVSPDHPIELLPPKRPIVAGEDEQDVESSVEDAEVVNSESDDSEGGGDGE